jgi:membrane protein required for colicin V production
MIWADWAILSIFLLSSLIGIVRGFVRESLSLVVWIGAAFIAKLFGPALDVLLLDHIETPSVRSLTAYASLFVTVLLAGSIISYLIGALVRATGLSGTDRLLGMLFGVARAFIIVMALIILLPSLIPVKEDDWWGKSILIPHFEACEVWVINLYENLSDWFMALFTEPSTQPLPTELPIESDSVNE